MKRGWIGFGAGAVILYAVILALVGRGQTTSQNQPAGSSTSAQQDGTLALAKLWQKQGMAFHVWAGAPVLLPADTTSPLVSVEPMDSVYTAGMSRDLLAWVHEGHALVWVTSRQDALLSDLGMDIRPSPPPTRAEWLMVQSNGQEPVWHNLDLTSDETLSIPDALHPITKYVSSTDETLGAKIPYGTGSIMVWIAPSVWENQGVGQGDNLRIVWSMVGGQNLLWDEFGHGEDRQRIWNGTFGQGREAAMIALIMAGLLFIWKSAVRFGYPQAHESEGARLGTEFLDAVAWHMRNPKLRPFTIEWLREAVRRQAVRKLRLPQQADWSAIERAIMHVRDPVLQGAHEEWVKSIPQPGSRIRSKQWRKLLSQARRYLRVLNEPVNRTTSNADQETSLPMPKEASQDARQD